MGRRAVKVGYNEASCKFSPGAAAPGCPM